MQVNSYQVEYHIYQDELTEYAVFCYFKYLYRNGCIYNYSSSKLATKSKYSASFIRKYINIFIKKEWCRMHGKNLIFNKSSKINGSQSKIKQYEEINIKGLSIKQIIDIFRFQRFKLQNRRFERKKQLNLDLKSHKKAKRHKAENQLELMGFKTNVQKLKLPTEKDKLKISNQILKQMFNCSAGKASAIIKEFNKKGLINVYRTIKKSKFKDNITPYQDEILKGMGVSFTKGKFAFLYKPLEFTIN